MMRFLAPLVLALSAAVTPAFAPAQEAASAQVQEMSLGADDAPVTVVEYASFTCPHCASFHEESFDQLKADYIDTGKVRFVYREVYFDRFGLWAGMLARCGGDEEKYFGIADMIYEKQPEWTAGDEPAEIADNLRKIGLSAGLEEEQIATCMQDGAKAEALVAEYQKNAEADDISSTPSFVIGGETFTNRPYDELAKLIDEQLGE